MLRLMQDFVRPVLFNVFDIMFTLFPCFETLENLPCDLGIESIPIRAREDFVERQCLDMPVDEAVV